MYFDFYRNPVKFHKGLHPCDQLIWTYDDRELAYEGGQISLVPYESGQMLCQ